MIRIATMSLAATALLAAAASAAPSGVKLAASLSGTLEVPGPGDTDGRGVASVTVNSGQRQVCYTLSARNIDTATMAHIHAGAAGIAGPVVVTLKAPASGHSTGCATVTRELALKILKAPGDYYVNFHNAAFPNGAIRGQLAK